jgi:hypothetical protein
MKRVIVASARCAAERRRQAPLADACLVRMSELDPRATVVALDSDFKIYRRNRRQAIPALLPR